MTVAPGSRLGPYEITEKLGVGGMGEVWRARDTRLGREVAVKVLRGELNEDNDLRMRFEREARTIASLSHPHICTLFDVGEHEGHHYLVMERLEGASLAARLKRGPLPVAEAITVAGQIAAALSVAHDSGIVHRDLKPGNVMLTRSGAKLLDFGLARLHAASHHLESTPNTTVTASVELPGRLVGTVPYMAPEQLDGLPASPRSDLWSFGAMIFEMVTGGRAFPGDTTSAVISEILHRDPPSLATLAPDAPPILDRLVRECLAKDPSRRWQSAADAAAALGWVDAAARLPGPSRRKPVTTTALVLAVAATGAFIGLAAGRFVRAPELREQRLRFTVQPPTGTALADILVGTGIATAPDGHSMVFVAQGEGPPALWLWSLEDGSANRLESTAGAASPFWSPDGRSIAFFAGGRLRRIDLEGGQASDLCDAPYGAVGTWFNDDRILFSQWAGENEGLYVLPARGGAPEMLPGSGADDSGGSRTWPAALPDRRRYLYLKRGYRGPAGAPEMCIGSFDSAEERCLGRSDSRAAFVPPDLVLFIRGGKLLAQRVDLDKPALLGSPVMVTADPWWFSPTGAAEFSASDDGRMLVVRGDSGPSELQWYDRSGRMVGTLGERARYFWPRLSPDGRTVAARVRDPESGVGDVWLVSTGSGIASRLTFEPSDAQSPTWSPDGRSLAYGASRSGPPDIFFRDLETGAELTLVAQPGTQIPRDLSPDGSLLAYEDYSPSRQVAQQIWLRPLSRDAPARQLSLAPASQYSPRFSPDGRTIAFVSEESGRPEVYLMPTDGPGVKVRVSPAAGTQPRWNGDGTELFYLAADGLLTAVEVERQGQLAVGTARPLFRAPGSSSSRPLFRSPGGGSLDYDVDTAGQRFLFTVPMTEGAGGTLSVTLGWQSRIRKGGDQARAKVAGFDRSAAPERRRS